MVGRGDDDCGCVCGFERVDVEPVAVGWDRRGAEAGLLDDQSVGVPAGVFDGDALDSVGAQPAAGER
jgi:hypothetical protein